MKHEKLVVSKGKCFFVPFFTSNVKELRNKYLQLTFEEIFFEEGKKLHKKIITSGSLRNHRTVKFIIFKNILRRAISRTGEEDVGMKKLFLKKFGNMKKQVGFFLQREELPNTLEKY